MRSTDIRQLRLDNIQWEHSRIDLRQSKTGEPLSLPLSEEVGAALIDYLRHGRPRTSRPEAFLRANAPFVPMAVLVGVISRYRCRAGIALPPPPRWSGMHSLRHSLASRLLEADTSFEVIAAVLGHRCERSTRSYFTVTGPR
jgi:integrase